MIGFVVVAVAIVIVGCAVVERAWRRWDGAQELSVPELVTGGAVAGLGIWFAIHWALALTHTFNKITVATAAIAFVAAAAFLLWQRRGRWQNRELATDTTLALALLLPLFFWIIYILWRATIVPPLSHDALAYHLPKALLMIRGGGFERLIAPDPRIGAYPWNYELLLADVLLLTGSDAITEWLGTAAFLLLLIVAAAVAQRWWNSRIGTLAVVLATASAPVLLLHSGADKNDLLTGFFAIAALLFGARWCARGGVVPMALLTVSLGAGVGTKMNLAAIGFGLAPFLLRRGIRTKPRAIAASAVFGAAVFLLCGGWSYISNWMAAGAPVGVRGGGVEIGSAAPIPYGDWFNLWQFPYLLLTVPFAPTLHGVWVPWKHEYWFWSHYELFWSHYGFAFTAAVLFLPFAIFRYRKLQADVAAERRIASLAALIALLLMLPVASRPIGFFGTYSRYFLFVLPIVYGWTLAPLAMKLARRALMVVLTLLAVTLSYYAVMVLIHDRFAPLEFVLWARKNPGTRMVWFNPSRAASVADRRAGPDDRIAVDGAFDTWLWPAYGATLSRPVLLLPANATPADIPDDVKWVIVDRSWSAMWGNEKLTDMGKMWKLVAKGTPPEADVRLFHALQHDPRFHLVFREERTNQAVFRRVGTY